MFRLKDENRPQHVRQRLKRQVGCVGPVLWHDFSPQNILVIEGGLERYRQPATQTTSTHASMNVGFLRMGA